MIVIIIFPDKLSLALSLILRKTYDILRYKPVKNENFKNW